MVLQRVNDTQPSLQLRCFDGSECLGFVVKLLAQAWVKQFLVQILVVVANIQMRTLKTEVEKGSM